MLTVALMFSLCTLGVFAEGETTTAGTAGTDAAAKDLTGMIISLSILGVIVIAVTLFCIIKREKVGKFFRSLKSETKKVVWLPWNQVRKNSIVVIIVVVIVAVVIGVLDFAFSQGIITLGTLFKK
jgi:preprotein translocase subunit SecE